VFKKVFLFLGVLLLSLSTWQNLAYASSSHKLNKYELQRLADSVAEKHNLHPSLFRAVVKHESTWRPHIVSNRGAIGLTQLLPATAKATCGLSMKDLYNPEKNLNCGAKYLSSQIKHFGSVKLALCAYNAGPPIVKRLGRCPRIRVTQKYVRKVTAEWRENVWGELLKSIQ